MVRLVQYRFPARTVESLLDIQQNQVANTGMLLGILTQPERLVDMVRYYVVIGRSLVQAQRMRNVIGFIT